MAKTLTGSQRLRAFIAGLNGKIAEMEAENEKWVAEAQRLETENRTLGQSVDGGNTRIADLETERADLLRNGNEQDARIAALEAEIAGFQSLADEYVPATAPAAAEASAKK